SPDLARGTAARPCPSTPAAPLHVPASLTIAAVRPGAPTTELGERPCSWTTASSPACTAAATAASRGAPDGAENGSPAAPMEGVTAGGTDGVTAREGEPAAVGSPP